MTKRFCLFSIVFALSTGVLWAVPLPSDTKKETVPKKDFLPHQKHEKLPGKAIGILLSYGAPVLANEGRSGPADQICFARNGVSYRWVYVPTDGEAIITNLQVPNAENKVKIYPKLNMANAKGVAAWKVEPSYSLVEVEVNGGEGSPVADAFVATNMRQLDGSKEFPLHIAKTIEALRTDYETYLRDLAKDLDKAMADAASKAIKEAKATGPREKSQLMFVTWMPETEKMVVRFRTKITDGNYKYGQGIAIELPPPPQREVPQGGAAPPVKLPNGLRFGTQFGIELGIEYTVNKDGKIEKKRFLELESFKEELPPPPQIGRPRPLPLPAVPPAKD